MSWSPTPNHPLNLPSTSFCIPSASRSTASTRPPNLKVIVSPSLLIPTPLLSERVTGRRLEECVDVTVPVGGRVGIGLRVDLGDLIGPDTSPETELDREEEVTTIVCETLSRNKVALGLRSTYIPPKRDSTSSNSQSPSFLLELDPHTACSSKTPLGQNLISNGVPNVHLTKVEVHFKWAFPVLVPQFTKRKSESNGGKDEIEEPQAITNEQSEGSNDIAEDLLANDESWTGLPEWALTQLRIGLATFIRSHLIRRFPLVFDAGLLLYSPYCSLPKSLPSSISHYLSTSAAHKTALIEEAKTLIQDIMNEEETYLKMKVQEAVRLPVRGPAEKAPSPKKVRVESAKAAKEKGPKRKDQADSQTALPVTSRHPEDRAKYYLAHMQQEHVHIDVNGSNSRARMYRMLEAMGRIGRARWQEARRGTSRMGCCRIKLTQSDDPLGREDQATNSQVAYPVEQSQVTTVPIQAGPSSKSKFPPGEDISSSTTWENGSPIVHPTVFERGDDFDVGVEAANSFRKSDTFTQRQEAIFQQNDESRSEDFDDSERAEDLFSSAVDSQYDLLQNDDSTQSAHGDEEALNDVDDDDPVSYLLPPSKSCCPASSYTAQANLPQSFGHDAHNQLLLGDEDEDMLYDSEDDLKAIVAKHDPNAQHTEFEASVSSNSHSQDPQTPPGSLLYQGSSSATRYGDAIDFRGDTIEDIGTPNPFDPFDPFEPSPSHAFRNPIPLALLSYGLNSASQGREFRVDDFETELCESDNAMVEGGNAESRSVWRLM